MTDGATNGPDLDERYRKGFPVSWDQFHRDARALAWRLAEQGPFSAILAITRGGLVPAAIVARELELREVETIGIASYDYGRQGELELLKEPAGKYLAEKGGGLLVVDDLVDTGNTIRAVRAMLPEAHYACVYAKPAGVELVDTFITEVSQDTWIFLPWDMALQFAPPIRGNGA